eukprot:scaffold17644_cov170-Amphora_coffeaeformis.AAC.2
MEKATGPLIQFIVTPLKNPRIPCSKYKVRIVEPRVGGFILVVVVAAAAAVVVAVFTVPPATAAAAAAEVLAAVLPVVLREVADRNDAARSVSRKLPKAVSVPTTPRVCILRLVTSNGYVKVWATNPAKAPQIMRSIVVKSRPVKCVIWGNDDTSQPFRRM